MALPIRGLVELARPSSISIRPARSRESIEVARLLYTSLMNGVDGVLPINRQKLFDHVYLTINSTDGFVQVAEEGGRIVGVFAAELQPHAYCDGYVASELGVYIDPEHRGGRTFVTLLEDYLAWVGIKPNVLLSGFTISQLGPTTPYLRRVLERHGFTRGSEGYYRYE